MISVVVYASSEVAIHTATPAPYVSLPHSMQTSTVTQVILRMVLQECSSTAHTDRAVLGYERLIFRSYEGT